MDTNKQKKILDNFIVEFLPKSGKERKYSTNEIDYVSKAVEWVCMKHFGFRPTPEEVLESFETLGYRLLEKKNDNGLKGELNKFKYIDVSTSHVKKLRLAIKKLPPNTNLEKINEMSELKNRIDTFKTKYGIL